MRWMCAGLLLLAPLGAMAQGQGAAQPKPTPQATPAAQPTPEATASPVAAPPTPAPTAPVAGCTRDIECKGDRICEGGICMAPPAPAAAPPFPPFPPPPPLILTPRHPVVEYVPPPPPPPRPERPRPLRRMRIFAGFDLMPVGRGDDHIELYDTHVDLNYDMDVGYGFHAGAAYRLLNWFSIGGTVRWFANQPKEPDDRDTSYYVSVGPTPIFRAGNDTIEFLLPLHVGLALANVPAMGDDVMGGLNLGLSPGVMVWFNKNFGMSLHVGYDVNFLAAQYYDQGRGYYEDDEYRYYDDYSYANGPHYGNEPVFEYLRTTQQLRLSVDLSIGF